MTSMTELLPCPFCGKPIEVFNAPWADGDPGWTYWHVDEMQAAEDKCPLTMACYDTKKELIEAWNTRAELGSGTCEPKWTLQGETQTQEFWRCDCGNCGECFGVESRESFPLNMTVGKVDIPNYCPNCGRKVVNGC